MGLDIDEPLGMKGEKEEGYIHNFDRSEYLARQLQGRLLDAIVHIEIECRLLLRELSRGANDCKQI